MRFKYIFTFAFFVAALAPISLWANEKPNVLMIVVDDLSAASMAHASFGGHHPGAKTPAFDRLINEGVGFTQAFANWPSCAPARQAFMSGALPEKTGYRFYGNVREQAGINRSVVYMGEHFKNNGYSTIRLDKIYHIGRDVASQWDLSEEPFGVNRNEIVQQSSEFTKLGFTTADRLRYEKFTEMGGEKSEIIELKENDTNGVPITANRLTDGLTKLRALAVLDDLASPGGPFDAQIKPFYMAVGFRRPHLPFMAPTSYYRKFKWGDGDTNFEPGATNIPLPPVNQNFTNVDEYRKALEGYYACLLMTSDHISDILTKLDTTGLANDTIVVVYGDHGYGLGEHNKYFSKGTPDNVGFHTPLIFRIPGSSRTNIAVKKAVSLIDVYPTLSDLCGLPRPETPLDGSSLLPLLQNNVPDWVENAVAFLGDNDDATLPMMRFIWANGYKYYESAAGAPTELYAVGGNDPFEWTNLNNNASYTDVRADLQARMDSLMQRSMDRTAPKLLQHPRSQVVPAGRSTLFVVRPEKPEQFSVKWSKDGVILAGQNESSLLLSNVQAGDAGTYACTLTNTIGRTFSYKAELKVLASAGELFDWQIDDTHAPFIIDGENGAPFEKITLGSAKYNNTLQTTYYSDRNGFAYVRPGLPYGNYEVYTHVPNWSGSAKQVTHVVEHRAGNNTTLVDQRDGPEGWVLLGTHYINPTSQLVIHTLTTEPNTKYPALDGARFKRIEASANSLPVALNEPTQNTAPDTPVVVNVLANDTDSNSDSLAIFQISGGRYGKVTFSGGLVTYTPHPGVVSATEIIRYQITDGKDVSNPAEFAVNITQTPHSQVVVNTNNGNGIVTRTSELTTYPTGANVTFTAIPYPGYQFYHWDGAVRSIQNPLMLGINSNTSLRAVFRPISQITNYAAWAGIQEWTNPGTQSSRNLNPDGDAFNNVGEFAFDLDPMKPGDRPDTTDIISVGGEVTQFELTYRRNLRAQGIGYVVKTSPNLKDWFTFIGTHVVTDYDVDGDFTAQEVKVVVPVGEEASFIKVEATVP